MKEFAQEPQSAPHAEPMRSETFNGKVRLEPIDFEALKARASIVELLESIGWEPVRRRRGGTELRGPCPIHKSGSATSIIFSVTPSRNIFRCFQCEAGGDTITLTAYLFGIPGD